MFGCQSYSFGSRSCHNGAVSQDGLGPNDNLVDPRHHGEDGGVCDDSRADLGLGEVAGHLVTRKVSSCLATITSNLQVLAAFFRNLSTVLDLPIVRMISLA